MRSKVLSRGILTSIMAILLVVVIVGSNIANYYSNAINTYLNDHLFKFDTYKIVNEDIDENADFEYFKSNFVKLDENGNPIYVTDENGYKHQVYDNDALSAYNYAKAEEAAAEGITLLWNNNNALPLAKDSKVSLFSRSSTDPLYGGGGSGTANKGGQISFIDGLENAGLKTNPTLNAFYRTQPTRQTTSFQPFLMNESPWSKVSENCGDVELYGDAAFIMISRYAAEHWGDMFMSGSDGIDGNQLNFSQEELNMFKGVIEMKNAGKIDKIILILNTCNFVNIGKISKYLDEIDACLWVGYPGNRGFAALGKIITGEYNPSGHLVNVFAYESSSAPGTVNYGNNKYVNSENYSGLNYEANKYYVYEEGIYVGYKYYETRYYDSVTNLASNALSTMGAVNSISGWNYTEEVFYPFGHGVSYSEFAYENFSVTQNGDEYTVSVDVVNISNVEGKEVVQIYLQKPYTEYDIAYGIEKSAVDLVGFAKTKSLAPGESETITVTVTEDQFKSYDANGAGTYILDGGDYYITAAPDSHAAVNNILAYQGYSVFDGMDKDGNEDMVFSQTLKTNFAKYSVSKYTGADILNQFDHADWNIAGLDDGNKVTYLSRSDWEATYPVPQTVKFTMTDELAAALQYDKAVDEDPNAVMPTYGKDNGLTLIMLKGISYDDPAWDDLLDQMTFDEQAKMLADCYRVTHAVPSIAKPATKENDAPMGIRSTYDNGKWAVTFPSTPIVAATYNVDLMYEIGEAKGEDVLHCGHNGLYGPGANIHRLPYSGRNFEYYSEDPYLTAIGVTQETMGIQSKGVYCILKHYALNDQEQNRWGVNTWVNEQAVREVYLLPFEYVVNVGNVHGLMSSFSRVGALWAGGDYNLCTEVLRNEWNFDGFVISDCQVNPYMSYVDGVLAGNDLWLYNILGEGFHRWEDSPTVCQAMRESTKRVLYTVVNSNAMNGISSNSRIVPLETWWQTTLKVTTITLGALTGLSALMFVIAIFKRE